VIPRRIVIRPALDKDGKQRLSERGPLYEASYEGELLLDASHQPFLDGCRALRAKGLGGPAEMWDEVRPYPRMLGEIEVAARLTVREPSSGGLRFARWSEWSRETPSDAPPTS